MNSDQNENAEIGYLVAPPLKVDLREERIWLDDEARPVGRKAFKVLSALMHRPEALWTKDDLIEVVWEGRSVSDAVLTTAMKELRRALDEPARSPKFIETVHGRGYRFLLPVKAIPVPDADQAKPEFIQPAPMAPLGEATGAGARGRRGLLLAGFAVLIAFSLAALLAWPRIDRGGAERPQVSGERANPSIAVLPFDDFSAGQDQGWFADGLVEEILNAMARSPKIRVAGRSMTFKLANEGMPSSQLAEKLGVGHVLEGSVRVDEDNMRITVQLIRVSDNVHIWSQSYDRPRSDIIAVQESIASEIADALGLAMNPVERARMVSVGTTSVKAYEHYLEALALGGEFERTGRVELADQSYQAFELARVEDPRFAAAHANAADYWRSQYQIIFISDPSSHENAKQALDAFRERISAAIANQEDQTLRSAYEASLAGASLEYRKQMRFLERYLEVYSEDEDRWSSYADAALAVGEVGAARRAAGELQRIVRETGRPNSRAITIAVHAGDVKAAVSISDFMIDKTPDQAFVLYQAHRAYLAAGDDQKARALLPRVLAGGLPKNNQRLAELRQACSDGNAAHADTLAVTIMNASETGPSEKWLALQIAGRENQANAVLHPLDTQDRLPQLASLLSYSFFDPAPFANLQTVLNREGAERQSITKPPYFCQVDDSAQKGT